jgi:hypothetical protein
MKAIKILLVAALLVVPLLVMGGASAKVDCDARPEHPTCPGVPEPPDDGDVLGGYTCEQAGHNQADYAETHGLAFADGGFSFTLSGRTDTVCIDVNTDGPSRWYVAIGGSGVRALQLIPRDSYAPGDSCGGVDLRGGAMPPLPFTQGLPDYDDTRADAIPESLVNACGTQFGEWLDTDGDGTLDHNELGQTGQPHPLAFVASIRGASDSSVAISVDCGSASCTAP